jgi:hypothetical protein
VNPGENGAAELDFERIVAGLEGQRQGKSEEKENLFKGVNTCYAC